MILQSHIFSIVHGIYDQYTTDNYTESLFKQFCKDTLNSDIQNQIAIHRNGNLMYYVYTHKRSDSVVYGISIVCCEICNDLKWLYNYFQKIFEISAHKGILFCYGKDGRIQKKVNSFSDEIAEIDNVFKEIKDHLNNKQGIWNVLPPENYTIPLASKMILAFSEDTKEKITDAIRHYHNVVVTMENTTPSSYSQTVKRLNSENNRLQKDKQSLEKKIDDLSKQKKQYKIVVILTTAFLISTIVILFFMSNVNILRNDISEKESTIINKNNTIDDMKRKIDSLMFDIDLKNDNIVILDSTVLSKDSIINLYSLKNIHSIKTIDSLQLLLTDKTNQYLRIKKYAEIVDDIETYYKAPIIITDIKIGNTDYDNTISPKYGEKIYSNETMFLKPQIHYVGLESGKRNIKVKWFKPDGSMCTLKDAPAGYSSSDDYWFDRGFGTINFIGLGSKTKGNWGAGTHRIEIWYNDICLKSKTFEIY